MFDSLINKYCQKVYENIKDYKTTKCLSRDGKLVLEGKINYKSGKSTNTSFIFESTKDKKNRDMLVGLNETFSTAKKPFKVHYQLKDNKLVAESLEYKYQAKINESSKLINGKVYNKIK